MTPSVASAARVAEVSGITPQAFVEEIAPAYRPMVLRGLAADWPAVAQGQRSPRAMADYLLTFDGGRAADVMVGGADIAGRFFYRDDLAGFNFERAKVPLPRLLAELLHIDGDPSAPALYAGSATTHDHLPGWTEANRLPLPTPDATPRVWIGNASRVSTHYDVSSNIAVVVAGRRRFALFPPDQTENLYVGPLDVTIAGQPTSLVDLEAPDLGQYPRFATALGHMQVADLEPGDAIFVPSLWWHDVKATGVLNVLVNYWWNNPVVSPFPALVHALLAIRDLPSGERDAVRAWFDHYVFGEHAGQAAAHLPAAARGVLDAPSLERTAVIKDYLARVMARS